MRSSSPPPGGRPPGPPSGKPHSGKKPYRAGGPRPATPRPPQDKTAPRRDDRRQATPNTPASQPERAPERPVLSLAAKPESRVETRPDPRAPAQDGHRPFGKGRRPARDPRPEAPRPDVDTPRGTVWLYGLHAVAAALQNPQRRLRRLVLTEESEQALAAIAPKPWPIVVDTTDRARIDQLLGRDVVHQNVALLADPLASPSLAQAMERPGPVLVLDQISDPRNVGAILRSALAFGACCVITQDRNAPDETGALAKAASGALERVPLLRAVNIARTLVALKAAGCWTVGLDAAGRPLSGKDLAQRRVALVLGSEGEGMRRLTRETCDELAGIPMAGSAGSAVDSLNVSAAATVALYELSRR